MRTAPLVIPHTDQYTLIVHSHNVYTAFRAQTVILIDGHNHVTYVERTLVAREGRQHHLATASYEFDLI